MGAVKGSETRAQRLGTIEEQALAFKEVIPQTSGEWVRVKGRDRYDFAPLRSLVRLPGGGLVPLVEGWLISGSLPADLEEHMPEGWWHLQGLWLTELDPLDWDIVHPDHAEACGCSTSPFGGGRLWCCSCGDVLVQG
jgi:hypothetical protein